LRKNKGGQRVTTARNSISVKERKGTAEVIIPGGPGTIKKDPSQGKKGGEGNNSPDWKIPGIDKEGVEIQVFRIVTP